MLDLWILTDSYLFAYLSRANVARLIDIAFSSDKTNKMRAGGAHDASTGLL